MSNGLKILLINPNTQTLIPRNIQKLFPRLISYRDVDKQVVRRSGPESNFKRILSIVDAPHHKSQVHEDTRLQQDVVFWKCGHCTYRNVPLMVNSLWRYYNSLCDCALCGSHRHIELDDSKDGCTYPS
eukprot:53906_1